MCLFRFQTFRVAQRHLADTAMEVEVAVSEESSEQENPNLEESDIENDSREESGAGDDVESDPDDDEKGEREVQDFLSDEEEEDEEDYCHGGYHRISPGDMLSDG